MISQKHKIRKNLKNFKFRNPFSGKRGHSTTLQISPKNWDVIRKVGLGLVLMILLWARLLSSYSAVREVEAAYPEDLNRGDITKPYIPDQEKSTLAHLKAQDDAYAHREVRLQKIAERENKAQRIRNFYAKWNAPMAAEAEYIVDVAEMYGLDWRLIPAISIVESTGGRYCFKSYNAFGWGKSGYGSFQESIQAVTAGLAFKYGTSNPYAIAPRYNPVTPDEWGAKVAGLMSQI